MFWRRLLFIFLLGGMLLSQPVAPASAATPCNWAQFVADVSVPDGSLVAPGAVFTKIWRVKNIGTCTWTNSYSLVFDSGSQMAGASPVNLPTSVAPGKTIDLAVILAAPSTPGRYRGYWKLSDASAVPFGIGTGASGALWVDVEVQDTSIVAYDLVAFASYAEWRSGAGPLPFPGTSGDFRGYGQRLDSLTTEDGAFTTAPSLITVPQNRYDGYIQALYPEFAVQRGDRFQAVVGCEAGSSCYVKYLLDYVTSTGVVRTFWSRNEMNDGRVYQANIDLSVLAGQTVRFRLRVLALGSPDHDRAVWVAPRIVRTAAGGSITPVPPPVLTPTSTPFGSPPVISPSACDKAVFVYDVTVPDGTYFAPGSAFSKTWRLKNSGTCTWSTSYRAIFYDGEQMSAPTSVNLPVAVRPGQTIDLTVNMVAPQAAGLHRGNWVLSNADGVLFGTGSPAVNPFWLQINVSGGTLSGAGYDFAANVCAAQWRNGSGALPCAGDDGDIRGFAIKQDAPHLEDGTFGTLPGLLVAPQFKYGGYIQGIYPAFTVQAGDRFQSMVGCEYKAPCYTTFRLEYMTASGTVKSFWSWSEKNDSRFYNANLDLSPLAGQSVRFILTLSAAGYANGDRAIWDAPHIQRTIVSLPSSPTPTLTPTLPPPGDDWLTGGVDHIRFKYPSQSQVVEQSETYVKIQLPFTPGTNLHEKYMEALVADNADTCRNPLYGPAQTSETVTINGIAFLKETAADGAAGSLYEWVAYTTVRNGTCASLGFVLHSNNVGVFPTPPPVFDKAAESLVFGQIMNTFLWMIPSGWMDYHDSRYGYEFKFPAGAQIITQTDNYVKFDLPIAPGTNLHEKSMEVLVTENMDPCVSTINGPGQTSETVTINGIPFVKQAAVEGGMMKLYDWVSYSTARDAVCVSFMFLMRSVDPSASTTPPPLFDRAAEAMVFEQIMNTFAWLAPTQTPASPPTETPTFSPTAAQPPPGMDWLTYANARYAFQLRYPAQGQIEQQMDNYLKLVLPITPGTNLLEKYLQVYVAENINPCRSPLSDTRPPQITETVVINGVTFLREVGMEGVTGQTYQWVDYSTARGGTCVSFNFVLHSRNPGNYPTPPVLFDEAAESAVFEQMVATFTWLAPTETPAAIPSITDTPTATSTPSATLPPVGGDWATYTNTKYGFDLHYPAAGQVLSQLDSYVKIALPFTPGTNLSEKHLQVYVAENVTPCRSPLGSTLPVQSSGDVVINGLSFFKESGAEGAAGQFYEWTAYSISRDAICVSLNFILHSSNSGNYETPPPVFDPVAEKAVFDQVVATFAWLSPITPVPSDTPTPLPSDTPTPPPGDASLPDLRITALRMELEYTACLLPDHPSGVRIAVFNGGNASAAAFSVRLGDVEQTVPGLVPGETATLFFLGSQYDGTTLTAVVDPASLVAESDESNNSMTAQVWLPTPPVPCTPTTPPNLIGPYGVVLLGQDVLPIRSDAGSANPVVASFPPGTNNILRTGQAKSLEGTDWAEVMRPDAGTGWVDYQYLTEFKSYQAFCADTRVPALITQLKQAVSASDGALFASLVSSRHGVRVNYWQHALPILYSTSSAQGIFADTTSHDWGAGPSGLPDAGTFSQVVQPDLQGVLASSYQLICDNPSYAGMFPNAWPYTNINYYAVLQPPTSQLLDWKIWLLGFEYVDGQPYLFATVHYIWEP